LLTGIQPIELRHRYVQDNRIGPQIAGGLQQFPPVIDDAYNLKLGFQETFASLGHERMVVSNQQAGSVVLFHTLTPRTGLTAGKFFLTLMNSLLCHNCY
jgi:hypothetical protein